MALHEDPFCPDTSLNSDCNCDMPAARAEHCDLHHPVDDEAAMERAVETAVMRALFPVDGVRRRFLSAVGGGTALAALSTLFPLGAAKALAQDSRLPLEKKNLTIGFLPITCATPLIMAEPMGFFAKEGLNVTLSKTPSWALVRDKTIAGEFDVTQMLAVMPLITTIGVGTPIRPLRVAAMQNVNGNAITMHVKHKDRKDPKEWKGMTLGIPFEFSMHSLLLRYFLAEHGMDPDRDVSLRVFPPPDFVSNLKAENIDGGLFAEPFNQRCVYEGFGYIHTLSKDIWPGHPCCTVTTSSNFVQGNPNTFAALLRAVVRSTLYAQKPENRNEIARVIAPANYLNQPTVVLEQVLTGRYADGLGQVKNVPDRIDFDPFPWNSVAVWILGQLKRWGYIKGDVDYRDIAERVFLATDARKRMADLGLVTPKETYKKHTIMGKTFDPAKPEEYLRSFAIKRA